MTNYKTSDDQNTKENLPSSKTDEREFFFISQIITLALLIGLGYGTVGGINTVTPHVQGFAKKHSLPALEHVAEFIGNQKPEIRTKLEVSFNRDEKTKLPPQALTILTYIIIAGRIQLPLMSGIILILLVTQKLNKLNISNGTIFMYFIAAVLIFFVP